MMQKEKKIDELVEELLDMFAMNNTDEFIFTDEIIEKIHFIADKCRQTRIYGRASNNIAMERYVGALDTDNMSAADVYIDMLKKIINAPTNTHMWVVPRLLLPIVSDKLMKENYDMRIK